VIRDEFRLRTFEDRLSFEGRERVRLLANASYELSCARRVIYKIERLTEKEETNDANEVRR
jgi:hypothetical protein